MLYAIVCIDKPDSEELRKAKRDDHLDYVADAVEQTSLDIFLAGPLHGDDGESHRGYLFIVEADDLSQAKSFSEMDPYRVAGVFERVDVYPFKKLLPKR